MSGIPWSPRCSPPAPDARFTDTPIYQLLADPAIGRVLTVNSSVAYEAPFF